jgi:hypothetical protein
MSSEDRRQHEAGRHHGAGEDLKAAAIIRSDADPGLGEGGMMQLDLVRFK